MYEWNYPVEIAQYFFYDPDIVSASLDLTTHKSLLHLMYRVLAIIYLNTISGFHMGPV